MKKKMIFFVTALCFMFALSGCGKSNVKQPYDYDLSEYVTLGEYKGVEVVQVDPEPVSDEQVEGEITQVLTANPTAESLDEGALLEMGDVANIDYVGTIDGVAFDKGSDSGYNLSLGSGNFIPGFEEGLVGVKIGDTTTLNLTFPEEYKTNEELSGKDVVFTVTVNSATRNVPAELTDEFVKTVSEKSKTVDQYKEEIKADLEQQAKDTAEQTMKSAVWKTVVGNSEIKSYPETELQQYIDEMTTYYKQYGDNYGMEFADVLESMGMTEETFAESAQSYAESMVGDELVLYSIIHKEKISLSDKEYKEGAKKYVEQMGVASVEELESYYTKETVYESLLWDKTLNFLLENAKLVDQITPSADDDTDVDAKKDETDPEEDSAE